MATSNASTALPNQAPSPVIVELQNLRNDIVSLAKALVALQQRVADCEVNTTEVRPQLLALKVHSESFPHSMREMRRADAALQKTVAGFEARLSGLESKFKESLTRE
jgi:hypothetical protein